MSEYWKSTPTYWCKFCEIYVRDTPLNKQQHEATGKHQGGIQRSLRKLHRDRENEERETQRAKDEVARLKGVVSGKPVPSTTAHGGASKAGSSRPEPPKQVTAEERKKQLKQLSDMGVAIPEEFRKEMAMASEWQTVSSRPLDDDGNILEEKGDFKSIGVRKRKVEEGEDSEDDATEGPNKKKESWGARVKTYANTDATRLDFDQLMKSTPSGTQVKSEEETRTGVKMEEGDDDVKTSLAPVANDATAAASAVKDDPDTGLGAAPVLFKKRKSKSAKAT